MPPGPVSKPPVVRTTRSTLAFASANSVRKVSLIVSLRTNDDTTNDTPIGSAILKVWQWPVIFAALGAIGIGFLALTYFGLPETLTADRRRPMSLRALVDNYALFLKTPGTKLPMSIGCASFAAQFAYCSSKWKSSCCGTATIATCIQ